MVKKLFLVLFSIILVLFLVESNKDVQMEQEITSFYQKLNNKEDFTSAKTELFSLLSLVKEDKHLYTQDAHMEFLALHYLASGEKEVNIINQNILLVMALKSQIEDTTFKKKVYSYLLGLLFLLFFLKEFVETRNILNKTKLFNLF